VVSRKLLIIGDTHIPDRALEIPRQLLKIIESERPYDIVIHTGDYTSEEIYRWVKSLGREVYAVEGNMDWLGLPISEVFKLGKCDFGVVHGDQVYPRGNIRKLTLLARELGVKILISGHTHDPFIKEYQGIYHINPGSLTGTWSGCGGSMKPSLIIAYYSEPTLKLLLYELDRGLGKLSVKEFKISI